MPWRSMEFRRAWEFYQYRFIVVRHGSRSWLWLSEAPSCLMKHALGWSWEQSHLGKRPLVTGENSRYLRSSMLNAIDNSLRARPGTGRCCGLRASPANTPHSRFAPGVFGSVTALEAGRILLAAVVSLAIWPAAGQAADAPAPSPTKLERISAFFDHEVATGKLPGAVILIQ